MVDASKLTINTHLETLCKFLETKHAKLGITYASQKFFQSLTTLGSFIIFNHLYSATFDLIQSFF